MRKSIIATILISIAFLVSFKALEKLDRTPFIRALKIKNENKKPFVIHTLIPLCDNENQGIVPVPKILGNGLDARNNLYWGALYGIKTHFKKSTKWQLAHTIKNPTLNILERCIFQTINSSGNKVFLIADAYRGDRMKACLTDYFNELAGNKTLNLPDSLKISTDVDLIVFNGHNGLMDCEIPESNFKLGSKQKETMAIGCVSYAYFSPYWEQLNTFPVLSTTNLMAPEGYVLEGALNSWIELKSGDEIHSSVANAYNKYQKCGFNGAKRLFKSG